jgi:RNA polymerase sigma-70 factor (ECF subfamily)
LHSRRETRLDEDGVLVLLEDQDRSRWKRAAIDEGLALVERALRHGRPGPYGLQAAIAALHAEAERSEDTDWPQIVALYDLLLDAAPSPVVALNRAAAVAMAAGPDEGLAALESIGGLEAYLPFHAARADLLRRLERFDEAAESYRAALALSTGPERTYLERRLAQQDSLR